jgi:hypothetical protein
MMSPALSNVLTLTRAWSRAPVPTWCLALRSLMDSRRRYARRQSSQSRMAAVNESESSSGHVALVGPRAIAARKSTMGPRTANSEFFARSATEPLTVTVPNTRMSAGTRSVW